MSSEKTRPGASAKLSPQKRAEIRRKLDAIVDRQRRRTRRAFECKRREREPVAGRVVAYDFETTRIAVGTPRPLYLTAYGEGFIVDGPCDTMPRVAAILIERFLIDDERGTKFVAWAGNRFDGYIVAAALLAHPEYRVRPFLTRNASLRGLHVQHVDDGERAKGWFFLDGIAMLGLEGVTLEKLLATFAPEYRKLTEAIDFESEEFDPCNAQHRAYALRDSVGLWHAMQRAQSIMMEHFDAPLAVTMGGACIKIFQAHIPAGVSIKALDPTAEGTFRQYVMRGGYCYCNRRYRGPVWKYDINQAYAAAMRETPMPCGSLLYNPNGVHASAAAYVAEVEAWKADNPIPFYYRALVGGRVRSLFAVDHIERTWLTSVEVEQLRAEGWRLKIHCSYQWAQTFTMNAYVDRLELLRTTCDGGPSGAIGTMVKATGNHSYGKTVEETAPMEFVIAAEQPDGFEPYFDDDDNLIENVWFRFDEHPRDKDYHAVQVGAFITASVRMKVRRAALLAPDAWLYADTDCVIFARDVTHMLDIDAKRYGAWKIEETGAHYQIIAKKVYAEMVAPDVKPKKRSAKGLNVKRLTGADFDRWYCGDVPVQEQVQRNNFLVVMQGAEMFRGQVRKGTRIEAQEAPGVVSDVA